MRTFVFALTFALAFTSCFFVSHAVSYAEDGNYWDNEVFFGDEKETLENFDSYFVSTQNARRKDCLDWSWKVEDGVLSRTNNVERDGDTINIAVLTYSRDTFGDFEVSVDFKAGSMTHFWPVVAIRQQIPGKYFLTPGGGAGIFMQQDGKITAWGPVINSGGGPLEQKISASAEYCGRAWHNLRIKAKGSFCEVYVDGSPELKTATNNTDYAKGYISLISVNNDCSFDNFKIRSLDEGTKSGGNEKNRSRFADDGTPLDDYIG